MNTLALVMPIVLVGLAQAGPDAPAGKSPVAFPHPLITEILYSVPGGKAGDADGNGNRSATGDEFIELFNPHDKPINLKGYVLSDASSRRGDGEAKPGSPEKPLTNMPYPKEETGKGGSGNPGGGTGGEKSGGGSRGEAPDRAKGAPKEGAKKSEGREDEGRMRFVFPDVTLQPGEVVVVFNGFESRPGGAVGTVSAAAGKNEKFHGAYVFTMNAPSRYVGLANTGDYVLLSDPKGKAVHCVHWGNRTPPSEITAEGEGKDAAGARALVETAPEARSSVQRKSVGEGFVEHTELKSNVRFSPGEFPVKK